MPAKVSMRTFVSCFTKLARCVRARIDARRRRIERGRELYRELDPFSPSTADDISLPPRIEEELVEAPQSYIDKVIAEAVRAREARSRSFAEGACCHSSSESEIADPDWVGLANAAVQVRKKYGANSSEYEEAQRKVNEHLARRGGGKWPSS
jgi:hypothetical protein